MATADEFRNAAVLAMMVPGQSVEFDGGSVRMVFRRFFPEKTGIEVRMRDSNAAFFSENAIDKAVEFFKTGRAFG